MDLSERLEQATEAQVRLALSNLLLGLAELGFGSDEDISGADAVQEIGELFEDTVNRCLSLEQPEAVRP